MQSLNINVTKIDKSALYKGAKGNYLNLTLMENKDGEDQYGNHGFIVQDIGKERRDAGERGPILGNWKHLKQRTQDKPDARNADKANAYQPQPEDGEDIPF
jgi:hypothetical protein